MSHQIWSGCLIYEIIRYKFNLTRRVQSSGFVPVVDEESNDGSKTGSDGKNSFAFLDLSVCESRRSSNQARRTLPKLVP